MDELAAYNEARWRALVAAGAVFTRPALDLDPELARDMVDPERRLGEIAGKAVLCLASGGGQQSAAFALLGAHVTVVDLSAAQLQQDQAAAAHYGVSVTTLAADMRDLSQLPEDSFDIVYHPYSLGFIPDAGAVFAQVARVIRPGGIYYVMAANPFVLGLSQADWSGAGYMLRSPYVDGVEVQYADQGWVYDRSGAQAVPPPREFRHTLSALVAGLVAAGFVVLHLADDSGFTPDPAAPPGSWDHFVSVAPPWLGFWTTYRPDVLPPRPAPGR